MRCWAGERRVYFLPAIRQDSKPELCVLRRPSEERSFYAGLARLQRARGSHTSLLRTWRPHKIYLWYAETKLQPLVSLNPHSNLYLAFSPPSQG